MKKQLEKYVLRKYSKIRKIELILREFEVKMNNYSVIAVVVTYNRKFLLKECLEAIYKQSVAVKQIILVDNASTDGTYELLEELGYFNKTNFLYKLMEENTGGSGGFYEGIKIAKESECDWVWVMDDDTIPTENCLEELLNGNLIISKNRKDNRQVAYLASAIYGAEGEYMNVPEISMKPSNNGYPYWYNSLSEGIVNISSASFVSILIKKDAILRCGLPCKDFFIWGDDTEYNLRLFNYFGEGFFVGKSIAIHKRLGAKVLNIEYETNPNRIDMFHYYYRNRIIDFHYYQKKNRPLYDMLRAILLGIRYLRKPNGFRMAKAVIKGHWEGITQYSKFKSFIDMQLKEGEKYNFPK